MPKGLNVEDEVVGDHDDAEVLEIAAQLVPEGFHEILKRDKKGTVLVLFLALNLRWL